MPVSNKKLILDLKSYYDSLSTFQKYFFPFKLGVALKACPTSADEALSKETSLALCKALTNNVWFYHRWFFSCLRAFSVSPLANILRTLSEGAFLEGIYANNRAALLLNHIGLVDCDASYDEIVKSLFERIDPEQPKPMSPAPLVEPNLTPLIDQEQTGWLSFFNGTKKTPVLKDPAITEENVLYFSS